MLKRALSPCCAPFPCPQLGSKPVPGPVEALAEGGALPAPPWGPLAATPRGAGRQVGTWWDPSGGTGTCRGFRRSIFPT